jgi:hypothetical protein
MLGILLRVQLKLVPSGLPMKGSSDIFRGPGMPHSACVVVGKMTGEGTIIRRSVTAL